MSRKSMLRIVHIVLLCGFLIAAGMAVRSLLTTDNLEGTIAGATIAAFIATFSAFLERIFPLDEQ